MFSHPQNNFISRCFHTHIRVQKVLQPKNLNATSMFVVCLAGQWNWRVRWKLVLHKFVPQPHHRWTVNQALSALSLSKMKKSWIQNRNYSLRWSRKQWETVCGAHISSSSLFVSPHICEKIEFHRCDATKRCQLDQCDSVKLSSLWYASI